MRFNYPLAEVTESLIGQRSLICQFVMVHKAAKIGVSCNICAQTSIEGDVVTGDRVTVMSNVQICDGSVIGDEVFIGPNASFSNDLYSSSKQNRTKFSEVTVLNGVSMGARASFLPCIAIGERAMVGAGAVFIKAAPAQSVVCRRCVHQSCSRPIRGGR